MRGVGVMKLMTAEKLISILKKSGCETFSQNGLVVVQGGGIHEKSNDHPFWKLIKLHYPLLCKHFGVPE